MLKFSEYQNRYKYVRFERQDGILTMAIHHDGGTALWGFGDGSIHTELGDAFYHVGRDAENKVIIFTGTGDAFLENLDPASFVNPEPLTPQFWDRIYKEGKDLLQNLLEIEVPIIGAVNGNAHIHAELVALSDIVLASTTASFADKAHAPSGTVPSDGVHIVWPMLLGPNRGRYFLLTGEAISAEEAKALGVVAEVLPPEKLMERAWELARMLAQKTPLMLRYSRVAMTQDIKRRLVNDLGYGLALEGLAALGVATA
jgi:enoyl-CoA hydratase/carnithine racemase